MKDEEKNDVYSLILVLLSSDLLWLCLFPCLLPCLIFSLVWSFVFFLKVLFLFLDLFYFVSFSWFVSLVWLFPVWEWQGWYPGSGRLRIAAAGWGVVSWAGVGWRHPRWTPAETPLAGWLATAHFILMQSHRLDEPYAVKCTSPDVPYLTYAARRHNFLDWCLLRVNLG